MRLDLYHAETLRIAVEQGALLDEANRRINAQEPLSRLEENGLLHALQLVIENAIGKAKQLLKARGEPVPVSAYDAFAALERVGLIPKTELTAWNAVIGLRNRIVHDYMNIDMRRVQELVGAGQYGFILAFLMRPVSE